MAKTVKAASRKPKNVTKVAERLAPKYKLGAEVFFIDTRNGVVIRGKVELSHTTKIPLRDIVSKKIVGEESLYNYTLSTNEGMFERPEYELFPNFNSVALKFTTLYLK